MGFDDLMEKLGKAARQATRSLAALDGEHRAQALRRCAAAIRNHQADLMAANKQDLEAARERGLAGAMLDRLELTAERIAAMADGLEAIADLPDPLVRVLAEWTRPNGLRIQRVAVPIGVIGVIYESRPNVTADAAGLCLKSGNAVVLRGGSEAVASNRAILAALHEGLEAADVDQGAVQMLPTQDHEAVGAMLRAHQWLDMVVPRGGKRLVARVQADARVPVLAHLDGNNHLYIHSSAEAEMAVEVVANAKMRRPGICGALETLLIDSDALPMLPALVERLTELGCELRGDEALCDLDARLVQASEEDWATEYLDAILAMKVVDGPDEALEHIAHYGSGHTDGIIAADEAVAAAFLVRLDSAIAVHNTSTQFADGGEFGFGAEIGIATGRLHARGPVGVEQLTTFQYRVFGSGQTRS
ncbi:glutamate-5-semialdehyde dehydrogenase [Wenzhouxiangella sp. AB-CW3]|uniref:glutamate-5-semialdehyde dehydrogenase n=1 Tax=Wenzhouxiangella sp. AB-CW3 TaxID=2771012 RepID=UPI00168A9FAE|nr:glutamate-5-semialdehyde dehydrogenase [Wenzhouxiangella sp. AB-CW3]QOC21342.1 glutamate-5-semialdehyde dehydrogenase [Wenzhouxiangella sp. AB-CW3]